MTNEISIIDRSEALNVFVFACLYLMRSSLVRSKWCLCIGCVHSFIRFHTWNWFLSLAKSTCSHSPISTNRIVGFKNEIENDLAFDTYRHNCATRNMCVHRTVAVNFQMDGRFSYVVWCCYCFRCFYLFLFWSCCFRSGSFFIFCNSQIDRIEIEKEPSVERKRERHKNASILWSLARFGRVSHGERYSQQTQSNLANDNMLSIFLLVTKITTTSTPTGEMIWDKDSNKLPLKIHRHRKHEFQLNDSRKPKKPRFLNLLFPFLRVCIGSFVLFSLFIAKYAYLFATVCVSSLFISVVHSLRSPMHLLCVWLRVSMSERLSYVFASAFFCPVIVSIFVLYISYMLPHNIHGFLRNEYRKRNTGQHKWAKNLEHERKL